VLPYCHHICIYSDPRDIAVGFSALFLHCNSASLGNWIEALHDMKYVDVIDCGHLEHNTNSNYHVYFFLNLSIVGDMREIILFNRRARERTEHLVPKRLNSFQFKAVPSGYI